VRAPAGTQRHSSSADPCFLARPSCPRLPGLPGLPGSSLDGKEAVDGSSPSEGLAEILVTVAEHVEARPDLQVSKQGMAQVRVPVDLILLRRPSLIRTRKPSETRSATIFWAARSPIPTFLAISLILIVGSRAMQRSTLPWFVSTNQFDRETPGGSPARGRSGWGPVRVERSFRAPIRPKPSPGRAVVSYKAEHLTRTYVRAREKESPTPGPEPLRDAEGAAGSH
jgi:hypothetical protein